MSPEEIGDADPCCRLVLTMTGDEDRIIDVIETVLSLGPAHDIGLELEPLRDGPWPRDEDLRDDEANRIAVTEWDSPQIRISGTSEEIDADGVDIPLSALGATEGSVVELLVGTDVADRLVHCPTDDDSD